MVALAREHDSVMVPSTIHALLAACLEQLEREDREVLERAAIEGEVFHKELICPHQPTSMGDRAFRFRHLLIRDAAYDALPKAIRAELHARFANWPEVNASELAELDEITGWHLEQTIRHRQELRHYPDPALAHRTAQHLHQAGRRAARRGDTNAARNLLERAHAVTPEDDSFRAQVAVDYGGQLIEGGDKKRASRLSTRTGPVTMGCDPGRSATSSAA
jgi:predicted ATPase